MLSTEQKKQLLENVSAEAFQLLLSFLACSFCIKLDGFRDIRLARMIN